MNIFLGDIINNQVPRSFIMDNNIIYGKNLRRMLTPQTHYALFKNILLDDLFVLSYLTHPQFQEEVTQQVQSINKLKGLDLISSNNKLTKKGKEFINDGVFPLILKLTDIKDHTRKRMYRNDFLRFKYKGKIITSNEWSFFDFQDINPEPSFALGKANKNIHTLEFLSKGDRGQVVELNFNNNVELTPLCLEVGKSLIFHTLFQGDTTKKFLNMQYRVAVRDYCYFINEYGAHNLKFLAKKDDFRPTGILVVKENIKVGMFILKEGNYYNNFDYNRIYKNYDDYLLSLKSILSQQNS